MGHPVFAATYDVLTRPLERRVLARHRARLLARARGDVLEVGAGTGANLRHYPRGGAVRSLDLTEPDPSMRRRLTRALGSTPPGFPSSVSDAPAAGPFPGGPYDTIVCTLVLCTVPDPDAAVAALVAALAEDGQLLFIEHVDAGHLAGRAQRLLQPVWSRLAGGCQLTRDTLATLRAHGLFSAEQDWLPLPFPLSATVLGVAQPRLRDGRISPVTR